MKKKLLNKKFLSVAAIAIWSIVVAEIIVMLVK